MEVHIDLDKILVNFFKEYEKYEELYELMCFKLKEAQFYFSRGQLHHMNMNGNGFHIPSRKIKPLVEISVNKKKVEMKLVSVAIDDKKKPENPIHWLGLTSPSSYLISQKLHTEALELIVQVANSQTILKNLKESYVDLLKRIPIEKKM